MIHLQHVNFTYQGSTSPALKDISLHIPAGSLVCLLGVNGSGKSTLLNLLAGLELPDAAPKGTEFLFQVGEYHSPKQALALTRQCALLMQDPDRQILGATVEEDLLLGLPPQSHALALAFGRRLGLEPQLHCLASQLSFGQKRKLCMATALARQPALLLFDEPLGALDYPAMREIRQLLGHNKSHGITQILSSHDVEGLEDLADSFILLHQGQLICHDTPEKIMPILPQHGIRPPCSWWQSQNLDPWAHSQSTK